MLRIIRSRLAIRRSLHSLGLRSGSSQAAERETVQPEEEPFGNEFGAGPSSRPYNAPVADRAVGRPGRLDLRTTPGLRQALRSASHGTFINPSRIAQRFRRGDLEACSDLDLHVMVHHIVRMDKPLLAVGLILEALRAETAGSAKRRRRVSRRTLRAIFSQFETDKRSLRFLPTAQSVQNGHGNGSRQPSPRFQALLDLLSALQSIRHPRPVEMYDILIRQAVAERMPDLAARIFVGMVEEWVTEGRVAEGAGPDDFHQGGGPPREIRQEMAAIAKKWWTGVRTWRLPGEVISPHDRIDLWHPENLLLGEKMKNFPFPVATSPPSVVPEPDANLLRAIIRALRLDPTLSSKADFEASMRALAILANTVLARTLPIQSLGELLRAFNSVPMAPPVYPVGMKDIPEANKWAYEAYTHIHLALQSLLYAPPMSAVSLQRAAASRRLQGSSIPEPPLPVSRYSTPPLNWKSCLMLVEYTLSSLKQPKLLSNLVGYMRSAFDMGRSAPVFWNTLFHGASKLKDNKLAQRAEDVLFDKTPLGRRAYFEQNNSVVPKPSVAPELEIAAPETTPRPDAKSLAILIDHLANSSQHDRLFKLVFKLIPFLDTNRIRASRENPEAATDPIQHPLLMTYSSLPPELYVRIVYALEKSGQASLAFRVFQLAMQVEDLAMRKHRIKHRRAEVLPAYPAKIRLPIDIFTALLVLAQDQASKQAPGLKQQRAMAAGTAAWTVYLQAKERWLDQIQHGWPLGPLAPDERFFDAAIRALGRKWDLYGDGPLTRQARDGLLELMDDMRQFRIQVPVGLRLRLKGEAASRWDRQHRVVPPKNTSEKFAAVLADMLLQAQASEDARPAVMDLASQAAPASDEHEPATSPEVDERAPAAAAGNRDVEEWTQSTASFSVDRHVHAASFGVEVRAGTPFWAHRDEDRTYVLQA